MIAEMEKAPTKPETPNCLLKITAKIKFITALIKATKNGVLALCNAQKAREKRGINAWANKLKAKICKAFNVKIVSCQSNFPHPKIILTTCARKTTSKMLVGIMKNKICLVIIFRFFANSFLFSSLLNEESTGKEAIANEIAKSPKGKLCKLLAKLKTTKLPSSKVEAMMVITMRLN